MNSFHSIAQSENIMKRKTCTYCFYPAAYVSRKSSLAWCEDCYISASDNFESSTSMYFDDFYDIEELNSSSEELDY